MDFGFVRGKYNAKTEDGPRVTSKDGFISYLLTIDVYTRYMWVFPTVGKSISTTIVDFFLNKDGNRYVHTKNGGNWSKATISNVSITSITISLKPPV